MNGKNQLVNKIFKIGGPVLLIAVIAIVGSKFLFHKSPVAYGITGSGSGSANIAVVNGDVQEVTIDLKSSGYAPIIVQKGIPVRFNIRAEENNINGCNGSVVIKEYNLEVALKPGDNIFEFTPDKVGTFEYSCWMGMITSSIQVVEDIANVDSNAISTPIGGGTGMPCCEVQ